MTVAFWQVVLQSAVEDSALDIMRMLDDVAEGELRLAASREDAEVEGPPRKTTVDLYWYWTITDDGRQVRRLEPANMLRVSGQPIPNRPAATMIRWEQDTRRRVWPATRRRPA